MAYKILPEFPLTYKQQRTAAQLWSRLNITANPDDCWEYQGTKNRHGYGKIYFNKGVYSAHRLAWYLTKRAIPSRDILHSCDNPSCCNPRHLRQGTPADNARDRMDHGKHFIGSDKPAAKLTEDKVRAARRKFLQGFSIKNLARQHDVSYSVMYHAVSGRAWTHIPMLKGIHERLEMLRTVAIRGEMHRSNKLTENDVRVIIQMIADNIPLNVIATTIGKISPCAVSHIKMNRTWKHVPRLLDKIKELG